jgi:hypothetical protein
MVAHCWNDCWGGEQSRWRRRRTAGMAILNGVIRKCLAQKKLSNKDLKVVKKQTM